MLFPLQELFIKICGITNSEDAELACSLGVNAIGFNFSESNERFISPSLAASISGKLPDHISKIGVFQYSKHQYIQKILRQVPLSAVQLLGNFGPDDLVGYDASVIKMFLLDRLFDIEVMRNYLVDAFLLGSKDAGASGLRKREYHWDIALRAKEYGRIILSGGLTPENVEDAIRFVQPYGIDVCEGVEKTTGKKDPSKLRDLIARARNVSLSLNQNDDVNDEN
jgi:phosphoribosylanthranilate isomerase